MAEGRHDRNDALYRNSPTMRIRGPHPREDIRVILTISCHHQHHTAIAQCHNPANILLISITGLRITLRTYTIIKVSSSTTYQNNLMNTLYITLLSRPLSAGIEAIILSAFSTTMCPRPKTSLSLFLIHLSILPGVTLRCAQERHFPNLNPITTDLGLRIPLK